MSTPSRRRGAPPGNLNALKHGFYSRQLRLLRGASVVIENSNRADDPTEETASARTGLEDEITLLRVYIRRVVELGAGTEDIFAALGILRVLSLAVATLNRLVKTQSVLDALAGDETVLALKRAIEDLVPTHLTGGPDPALPDPDSPDDPIR